MARESALAKLPGAAKAAIVIGWLALMGVVYFVVFYGDLASSIKAAQNQEQKLHKELADARKAEFAYLKDKDELEERQQRQSEINRALPTEKQVASFLIAIQNAANVSGVNLMAWTPQEERSEQFYARVPMQLELTGRYHQVAKFFYQVGQLDRIINMENISITHPETVNEEVSVKVSVLATTFRMVESSQQEGSADDKRAQAGKRAASSQQGERGQAAPKKGGQKK
jgi:type IV pilus assembly protein PilO